MNLSLSPFPDDQQHQHQLSLAHDPQASSSSSSLSFRAFMNPLQDHQQEYYHREIHQLQDQKEPNNLVSHGRSHNDHHQLVISENETHHCGDLKISLWKRGNKNDDGSAKLMPSKIRLMGRMMKYSSDRTVSDAPKNAAVAHQVKLEDHDQKHPSSSFMELADHHNNNYSSYNNNIMSTPIRVCADCKTTKTPLWRSGPRGPKSLCNACGIRQRKARRAMVAAAAAVATCGTGKAPPVVRIAKVQSKDKRSNNGHHVLPYKKRCRLATPPDDHDHGHGRKNPCFEDFFISLNKNLAFHRVFPQDEKEAAILLMALSCGLVHG